MRFSIYLHGSTLSSPGAVAMRKAAFNAVHRSLTEKGEEIKRRFGVWNWFPVV
jgi:hypothetical protein